MDTVEFADFKKVVEIILNNWTALELAIEHNYGGPRNQLHEKLTSLVDQTYAFLSNDKTEDLSDFLEDFLESELQTVVEDESPDEVSDHLVFLYKLWADKRHNDLVGCIQSCRCKESILDKYSKPVVNQSKVKDNESMSEDESMSEEEDVGNDDGWTVVKRK